jgi:hypothetical protein
MKPISNYILERLNPGRLGRVYNYFPKTKEELQELLKELIDERGNEGDFNDIDTSRITDMSELFRDMKIFNGNISKWDVSEVESMDFMFCGAKSFNRDISEWDVKKVKYMYYIFDNCHIEEKYKPKFNE